MVDTVKSKFQSPPQVMDLREKILSATAALVAERGVRGVSIREVARRAGVSHQAPYHHFGDQAGLMRELAREGFVGLSSAMRQASASSEAEGGGALERLVATGKAYVLFALEHPGHLRVMFQTSLVVSEPERGPVVEGQETYQLLLSHAEAACDAGHGQGMTKERLAALCWSLVHGCSMLLLEDALLPPGVSGHEARRHMTEQLLGDLGRLL